MATLAKMLHVLFVSVGLTALVLIHSQPAFARGADDPCPCIAEEYKSEKAYPLYKQAALAWRARKWEDAILKHHQVIAKYPSSPLAAKSHMGIGLYLKYLKYYDEAIPEFQKGISMLPGTRSARDAKTSVACIYTAQGKYDDALNTLREVLAQAKDWDEVKYCSYWLKEIARLKAHRYSELKACGPKVLATIFRLKGITTSKQEMLALVDTKSNRTSIQDLKKAAEAKGLKATGVRLSLAELKSVEMPVVTLVKPGHYIVISSADEKGFTIIDSARGERAYTVSETVLQRRWTGYVILFADKTPTKSGYALLTKDVMEGTYGGVCDCCPEGDLGKTGEGDDPPSIWVNMVNLNMVLDDTDLSYSGLGPSVEIKRTYNADDSRESAFGRSWTHNYNIYLTEEPSGDVLVSREDGRIDRYYYTGGPSTDMSGIWKLNFVCTSTTCPDWGDIGGTYTSELKVTQSGNELTAYLYDANCEMSGTVDGNSFILSGYWTEIDWDCVLREDLLIEGTVDVNSLSAISTITLTPVEPGDPNCAEMIGSGCEEVHATTGVRRVSDANYITYEPGVYDSLIKNGDGSWSLEIKEDKTIQYFDPNGRLTSIIDRNGNALVFGYDVNDNLTSITDATGRVTTLTYDPNNNIVAITDPIGRNTSYTYDANGNLTSSTDMEDNTTTYSYDQYSYMTSITTLQGTTTIDFIVSEEWGYSLRSITDALGNTRSYGTYWTSGEDDVFVTDAKGNTTYYDNTDYGLTEAITDPLGNTTSFGYDIFGNRTSVTNPNGKTTNTTYDARGNITNIADPLGNVTTFTYDDEDNLTQLKGALNRSYSYTYDVNDNLVKVTDPLSNQTNFTYDSNGQITDINDARGNTTTFTYDPNGNLVSSTDPCGHTTNYTYDGVGRMLSRMDAKGNTVSYTWDDLDRKTEVNYPDGTITYNYACCNLSSITDKAGRITDFEYDALNRLTKVIDPCDHTIRYEYDEVGNRELIVYPDSKEVEYTYDWANQLTKVRDWMNNNTIYTYDPAGNLTSTKYLPFGIVTTYLYDDASRLISLETKRSDDSIICSYQYTLDAVGNRVAVSGVEPIEPNLSFADISYTYNQDNQLLSANGTTFQYDENGNLIQKTEDGNTTTYTYDYDNRLIQVSSGGGGSIYQYEYDGLGNRVAKIKDSVSTEYFVDINRELAAVLVEADANDNIRNYYIYGLGLISTIARYPDSDPCYPWYDLYYYHYDGLGNTVAITDEPANVVNKYAYTPFGKLVGIEEEIPNPFRYVGKFGVMDDENGLLYMRARYYDPAIGRFFNKDPIGISGGLNLYEYVGNSPVNLVDPSGLAVQWWRIPTYIRAACIAYCSTKALICHIGASSKKQNIMCKRAYVGCMDWCFPQWRTPPPPPPHISGGGGASGGW